MATTLLQYRTAEEARLANRLAAQDADVRAKRTTLATLRAALDVANEAVRLRGRDVDDARKALSGIPMPADGDPLLLAMEAALVALAEAEATFATSDLAVKVEAAAVARSEEIRSELDLARTAARRELEREKLATASRDEMVAALTSGKLATLAADAAAAIAAHGATARSRVESEFPTNADAAKSMLARARARRDVVQQSLAAAVQVEAAAFAADTSSAEQARRAFDVAANAIRWLNETAPRLDADRAALKRLAELPAPAPATFPIVSASQHARMFDATKLAARESALAKVTDVDTAALAVRIAQQAYDVAVHAEMKASPDKTPAELDAAASVAPKRAALDGKITDLGAKRTAVSAGDRATVKSWFATVPEPLWTALDKHDLAAARLAFLANATTLSDAKSALVTAETALVAAMEAAGLAQRRQAAADLAAQRAADLEAAERETVLNRSQAFAHSAALL